SSLHHPPCQKKSGRGPLFCLRDALLLLRHLGRRIGMDFKLFLDTRRFPRALAQVIQLRTSYIPAALHFDARDQRGVRLKRSLDTLA
ncbi:MAG: hypothetical protein V7640_1418, partial [Betaproteobacteria bacterium]